MLRQKQRHYEKHLTHCFAPLQRTKCNRHRQRCGGLEPSHRGPKSYNSNQKSINRTPYSNSNRKKERVLPSCPCWGIAGCDLPLGNYFYLLASEPNDSKGPISNSVKSKKNTPGKPNGKTSIENPKSVAKTACAITNWKLTTPTNTSKIELSKSSLTTILTKPTII